jgi:thiamine biosynthesis lipoprotein
LKTISRSVIYINLFAILVIGLSSCSTEQKRYEVEFLQLFDTVTRVIGYTDSEEAFSEHSNLIYENLKAYHELYDIYNDYGFNNIKTINDKAGVEPVKVDRRIIDLLLFSKEAYEATYGAINVAMGAVLSIWHEYRSAGTKNPAIASLPPMADLAYAAEHCDINNVIINTEDSTVYLSDPEMSLDVGAVAKGYAVEMVAKLAEESGMSNVIINAGGNVRAIGDRGESRGNWTVGVQNPNKESSEANLVLLSVADKALVTSGSYKRYFIVDGVRYSHIIDPNTLMPAAHFESVTVIAEDSGWGDAYSTALFNMPFEEGLALVEVLEGVEAIWVFSEKRLEYSSGVAAYIKE